MIYSLSNRYQRQIAFGFIYIFFLSGIVGLKAQAAHYPARQSNLFPVTTTGYTGRMKQMQETVFDMPVNTPATMKENKIVKEDNVTGQGSIAVKGFANLQQQKPDIGGPSQPEMSGFRSVGADNMVSPFTGDFSYNIPLLDVGGYPVNMFYSSGIGMDQEASWLGLGWNINPGTITRNMRGLPDDFNGSDKIIKTQSFRDDKTFGLTTGVNIKLVGFPLLNLGASWGLSWNNKLGISAEAGINAAFSISGKNSSSKTYGLTASAALNASSRNGASVSPSISLQKEMEKGNSGNFNASIGMGFNYSSRMGLSSMHLNLNSSHERMGNLASSSGTLSFAYPTIVPAITKPFTRRNYSVELSAGGEFFGLNPHFKLRGYYSHSYLADEDKVSVHPAFGVMHLQASEGRKDALLDFNRANDGVYTPATPTIGMPVYTYDVFSLTGEGTGGSFRTYRGDIGHVRDPLVKTKDKDIGLGLDLGFGNTVHVGADLNYIKAPTETGDWEVNNMAAPALPFKNSNATYQSAYFKNPGEKTVPDANFQSAMGDEDLVRFKLANINSANPMVLPKLMRYNATKNLVGEKTIDANSTLKINRDKRTQVISCLTAEETERIGMLTKLYSYNAEGAYENKVLYSVGCNMNGIDSFYRNHDVNHATNHVPLQPQYLGGETQPFRRKHHISEVDVVETDGKRYIYGLPVYNKKQVNVTFSIDAGQKQSDSKAQYTVGDNSISNERGRDHIVEKEEIPAYTHSYLLTELLSANYVDITGNGITEDDMGDAVKFNYSKYADYKWRTPVGNTTASYSSGLNTDEKDDKAHYVYGERESWYLYSIESKNMVARFYVKSDRKDGRPVKDENGDLDLDPAKGMKRLDKINLYTKGDLTRYGDNARPVKTIRFFQSYKLCRNTPAANELGSNTVYGQGKLTLDSIWISYNGNTQKPKNRYVFYYPDNNNPNYSFDQSDRWGTYKPKTDNPDNLSNEIYPYSIQDKKKADKNAAAWAMNKILLPSGALITVDYESDAYGYVQNKKAASMCKILGFGKSTTALPAAPELPKLYANNGSENDKVYIQLPQAITATGASGRTEFAARYLQDPRQLYLKLSVVMPVGSGLSGIAGEENIPVYADIADYGLISPTVAWVSVKNVESGHTPMVQTALQFLMQQLPGKAYKGYDLNESDGLESIVTAMAGMLSSMGSMFNGEMNAFKSKLKCQQVALHKSFARLTHPVRNKLGGGHRVKRIIINDNWSKMTGQRTATYGQEYNYTTTEMINGKMETISSGVASWEPSIGGDENPHREIMRFMNHNRGGPYDFGAVEMPLGEMFYPSPMIGYSRVEVLSIHRDTVKNQPTREVTEFYTNKEFPYKSSCTDLSGDANAKYEPAKIMQLLRIDMRKGIAQSQGFLVETNDMHGKQKSHAVYTFTDPANPVTYTENFYNIKRVSDQTYGFNHDFPVIEKADGKISNALIGRDIELMTDFRQHRSETFTTNISINFDLFFIGPIPVPLFNILQPVAREGTMYRSAAVLKTVTHYGMVDSVVVIDKGSMISTKNLVYDAETGNALLTRTQNEHNKPVYNFSYPAHWAYSGMGPAYRNIDAVYAGVQFTHGILTAGVPGILNVLESGDELYTVAQNNTTQAYSVCDDPANINPANYPWTTLEKNPANRIWAVQVKDRSGKSLDNAWVFMDAKGNPYNAVNATIRIVRSGKRNMLDQSVAAIRSLNNPIVNGQLVFDEATNIVQTTAATFRDHWRVDNSWYKASHLDSVFQYARVHKKVLSPEDHLTARYYYHWRDNGDEYEGPPRKEIERTNTLLTYKRTQRYWKRDNWLEGKKSHNISERKNSFLLYNYNAVPPNTEIYKGLLSLYAHSNYPLFPTNAGYPSTHHPGVHNASAPNSHSNILGEVFSLNKGWMANGSYMVDNYFNSDVSNVSYGMSLIHYPNGFDENYYAGWTDNRVNVTLPMLTNNSAWLKPQRKIGFKLRAPNDEALVPLYDHHAINYRCFWAPQLQSSFAATPKLDYYYYAWNDVSMQANPDNDPALNTLLTKLITTTTSYYCASKFTRKAINPYVEGILGNWRIDSTYAYYGERKESDPGAGPVDTRIGGAIRNYQSFWNFATTGTSPAADIYLTRNWAADNVWVWNNTTTQYNRKGYEIENTDPLGRFNAGLYGYNQQLPVAVANNSRVREILFDGFEDYDYSTSAACIDCLPSRHFKYNTTVQSQLDPGQSHTGQYSLRINPSQSISIEAPVATPASLNGEYGLNIVHTKPVIVAGALGGGTPGTGLRATWYNHAVNGSYNQPLVPTPSSSYPQAAAIYQETSVPIIPLGSSSPKPGVSPTYFSVRWTGILQAPATGAYNFSCGIDGGVRIKVAGVTVLSSAWGAPTAGSPISLQQGQKYPIEIDYYNDIGTYKIGVSWNFNNNTNTLGAIHQPIPVECLYLPGATSFRNVVGQPIACSQLQDCQIFGNGLTDSLSLIEKKKMVLGAWVKVGTANCCFPASYADHNTNSITIAYNNQPVAHTFRPAGPVIEGWQRYESVFEIPGKAANVTISLNNTGNEPVFFDDLRLHPFNANMKTYVYHSSNLRLMAELDENNYSSLYEYDDDGALIRTKKETQAGIKTIQETRSATQKTINE